MRRRVALLGHRWDERVRQLRTFLGRNQISYDWIAPDAPDRDARWPGPPIGNDELPALVCEDGELLRGATSRDVAPAGSGGDGG